MTGSAVIHQTAHAAETPSRARSASRSHVRISLVLLLIFIAMCLVLDTVARSPRVADFLDDRAAAEHREKIRPFVRTHNYGDWFETLMLGELPKADYSNGGAYFF